HAELLRRLLTEGQEVELARVAQHEPEARRQEDREEPECPRGDRREVAEEPVDHTTEPVHVEKRDDHGDRRGEEDPDDDAREEQGLDLDHPLARRGDQIDGGRRQESAATAIRGRRIERVTTLSTDAGAARPVTAPITAPGEIAALPMKSAAAATATRSVASPPTTSASRACGLT